MAKTYVVNGATLKCVLGAAPSTLTVLPVNRVEIGGKAKANIMDCKPMVNIKPAPRWRRRFPARLWWLPG